MLNNVLKWDQSVHDGFLCNSLRSLKLCCFLTKAPSHCPVPQVFFFLVPHLWCSRGAGWGEWGGGGGTLPCAVPFTAVQAPDSPFVLLVLLSKSCFLPQEDDSLSVLPAGTGRKRGCLQKWPPTVPHSGYMAQRQHSECFIVARESWQCFWNRSRLGNEWNGLYEVWNLTCVPAGKSKQGLTCGPLVQTGS